VQADAPPAVTPKATAPEPSKTQAAPPRSNPTEVTAPQPTAPQSNAIQATAPQTNAPQPGPAEATAPQTNAPQPGPTEAAPQTNTPSPNPAKLPAPSRHTKARASSKKPPASPTAQPQAAEGETLLPAGRFGKVTVYIPDGTPQSVAIFVSGDGGWNLGVVDMAHALTNMGAVVIGVDIRQYLGALGKAAQRPNAPCQLIAGDFENLSHQIQKEIGMLVYHVPVLIGYSSGATVVYATLVQSPPGTFAGALSLGFCPDQDFAGATLCPGPGLHYTQGQKNDLIFQPAKTLKQPWIALQGQKDQVCDPQAVDTFAAQTPGGEVIKLPLVGHGFGVERNWMPQFQDAYRKLTAHVETPPVRPPDIGDLPVNEVRADDSHAEELAILLTGDGGWAGLDQELAAGLAADGVPTVGLNSLKYFWTARTPAEAAQAVARIMRHYLAAWNKQRVLLVGYSFGADVLPFVVNRLPPDLRARVATINLLGVDSNASFEINIAAWVGSDAGGPPTRPEIATLGGLPILCVYGEGESDSICPGLPQSSDHIHVALAQIGKGHHFSGEYATLAQRILAFARGGPPIT
jgi:type IV secretory pathway VirJ component